MKTVRVVVSCTDSKKVTPVDDLRLRAYPDNFARRSKAWNQRIGRVKGPTLKAGDLYKGPHWSVVRELPAAALSQGVKIDLWVASAGYGLVHVEEQVESYSATFSLGSPDSVVRGGSSMATAELSTWWQSLSERPRRFSSVTSLTELVETSSRTPLLVALSHSYLRALQDDILSAEAATDGSGHLLLISAREGPARIRHLQVPFDGRFQGLLGGSLGSLNVRLVRLIIEESQAHKWRSDVIRKVIEDRGRELPVLVRPQGEILTDPQVRGFIRESLKGNPTASCSTLLRELRQSGRSCEQKRFSNIFSTIARPPK